MYTTLLKLYRLLKMFSVFARVFKILLMKMFVGKNTPLKQAAIGHAIMQAVRPRAVIAPFKYLLVCNCT